MNISRIKIFLPLTFIFITLVIGARYNVGPDYFNYAYKYNHNQLSSNGNFLFNFLIFHFRNIGFNSQIIFMTYSVITFGALFKLSRLIITKKESSAILFIVLSLSLLPSALNIIRQASAIPMLLIAMHYLSKSQNKLFLVYSIIAIFLHEASIILIIISPLYIFNQKVKHEKVHIIYILTLLIIVSLCDLSSFIKMALSISSITDQYNNLGRFSAKADLLMRLTVIFKISIILLLAFFINKEKVSFMSKRYKVIFLKISFVSCLFLSLSTQVAILGRLYIYYRPIIALIASLLIFNFIKRKFTMLCTLFISNILLCSLSLYTAYRKESASRHYSANFCMVGPPCPVNIIGNLKEAKEWTQ